MINAIIDQQKELPFAGHVRDAAAGCAGRKTYRNSPQGLTKFLYTSGGAVGHENAVKCRPRIHRKEQKYSTDTGLIMVRPMVPFLSLAILEGWRGNHL